ncbi:hypothetical protein KDA_52460 [Dictyobacter alpinus]|uniref:Uncharacterized protein n=1 Tax=Dictyobacter alpinus TaxID=2014873 RepID=A0A402BEP8_9CHLR|nr:hypothetical protein [Dictyobacter alpinus]GCE29762.1 hypothetical protein KDA_52460 [Dictyobacter alpinus]
MKLEIGYGLETYGTVESTGNGFSYAGENPDALRNLIESMQELQSAPKDPEDFLLFVKQRLISRTWAKAV